MLHLHPINHTCTDRDQLRSTSSAVSAPPSPLVSAQADPQHTGPVMSSPVSSSSSLPPFSLKYARPFQLPDRSTCKFRPAKLRWFESDTHPAGLLNLVDADLVDCLVLLLRGGVALHGQHLSPLTVKALPTFFSPRLQSLA